MISPMYPYMTHVNPTTFGDPEP